MKRTTHKEFPAVINASAPQLPIVVQGIKGVGICPFVNNLAYTGGTVSIYDPLGGDPNDRGDLPYKGPADWKKRIFSVEFIAPAYKVILNMDKMPLRFQYMAINYFKSVKKSRCKCGGCLFLERRPDFQRVIFMVDDESKLEPFFRTGLVLRGGR